MSRAVPEWIGKSHDTPIPPRVKLRVFERHSGRCYLSGRLIRAGEAWDCDHVIALTNGGENRESNLAPALHGAHQVKTCADLVEKAEVYRKRAKHLGIFAPKRKIKSAMFRKAAPQHSATRPIARRT